MFKNYLKLAFRHLARKKVFSFINIFGLTLGLTSCILIGLYITDELSFDKFHTNAQRIVRITSELKTSSSVRTYAVTSTKPGPQFKRTFPEVEDYTRTELRPSKVTYNNTSFNENNVLYADPSLLTSFTFPLLQGTPSALEDRGNILITASTAKKYFGTTDPLGKTLKLNDAKDYRVAGILKDAPSNSQIQFDFVINFTNLGAAQTEIYNTANYITYLLIRNAGQIPNLEQRINAYMDSRDVRAEVADEPGDYLHFHLEPLTRVHLYSSLEGFTPNGNITYIIALTIIAVLILVIAGFNYTNLAIAQSSSRTGEIGIRKVLGAAKSQLFTQFTGESLLIAAIALVLAIVISTQLLSVYNDLTGKHLVYSDILQVKPLLILLITGIAIGLLAGAYPALVLANTRLINVLKSGFRITGGKSGLRRTLIIVQFVISFFLISTTIVILQQMNYVRSKKLGLDRDHVLVIPFSWRFHEHYASLKSAMLNQPGVEHISGSYDLPIAAHWGDGLTAYNGKEKVRMNITAIPADLNYLTTMNMQLLAGSDFTAADLPITTNINDSAAFPYRFILNETAIKAIGWTPQEAIGKTVSRGKTGIVKGVVKDFHFASMHEEIGPLMLFADTQFVRYILVRVNGQQMSSTISSLQGIWKGFLPSQPFDYHFLDEDYNKLYKVETRTAGLFTIFSSLAILLACLGLFGLSAISAIQRTKEIGIRKVLGASLLNITLLMAKNFILMVGVGLLIAVPLAWLAANSWLKSFAYRIDVQPWVFLLAGLTGIALAFLTVSFHAVKAGRKNPSETLKTE
ncbi:MAG: ABC transporter permease [Bacteroidetes bacterium]|nr:ABC transporter permease [Bacteroidota bacterium]